MDSLTTAHIPFYSYSYYIASNMNNKILMKHIIPVNSYKQVPCITDDDDFSSDDCSTYYSTKTLYKANYYNEPRLIIDESIINLSSEDTMENLSNYQNDNTYQNINCDFESRPLREKISNHINFETSGLSLTKDDNSDEKNENKKIQDNIGEKTMEQNDNRENSNDNPFDDSITNDFVFKMIKL